MKLAAGLLVALAFAGVLAWNVAADRTAGDNLPVTGSSSTPRVCHVRGRGIFALPDASCTPGAINAAVTQASIGWTICRAGWTRTVRPPASVTEPIKRQLLGAYGYYAGDRLSGYELDHLVPLELGGATVTARNLWPEVDYAGISSRAYYSNPKDKLESTLNRRVCAGRLSLARARYLISSDWVDAYRRYVR
jgi:hypothetical protein